MRLHIVGMGPIGSLVSFHLRRALSLEHSITIIHKEDKRAKSARGAGGEVKLESNGVVLSARGFRHQSSAFSQRSSSRSRTVPPQQDFSRHGGDTRSAPAVFFDGLRRSMYDLFHPHEGGLLRTGKFWSGRLTRREFKRPPRPKLNHIGHIDTLFVCVKAQSTLQTIRGLRSRLSRNSTIILLQNGMGVYEELVDNLFPESSQRPHIITAVISHGVWLKDSLHVVHAGVGKIDFGIMPDGEGRDFEASYNNHQEKPFDSPSRLRLGDISRDAGDPAVGSRYRSLRNTVEVLLSLEPLQTSWVPLRDAQMAMRRKVVINAVVNPLTALLGCKNGQVLQHPEGRHLCRAICREAESVFRAQWNHERQEAGASDDLLAFPSTLEASHLEKTCMDVAATTSENTSSMLIDVRSGRQTEIRYLTGYLLDLGRKYGVRMLTNQTIYNMVRLRTSVKRLPEA